MLSFSAVCSSLDTSIVVSLMVFLQEVIAFVYVFFPSKQHQIIPINLHNHLQLLQGIVKQCYVVVSVTLSAPLTVLLISSIFFGERSAEMNLVPSAD